MDPIKAKFKQRIKPKLSARTHMSLILLATVASGIVASKLTLYWTEISPVLRYGMAVLFSYGMFFLLMRLWLHWVFGSRREFSDGSSIADAMGPADLAPLVDLADPSPINPSWHGGGGQFSGGGAQASWANADAKFGTDSSSILPDADVDVPDELGAIIALIVLITAIFGSATYIVYQAPELMLEAAFEVLLAAGLFRRARKISSNGWAIPLFKGTWVPFLIVLIFSLGFGSWIHSNCPDARSYGEMKEICLSKK